MASEPEPAERQQPHPQWWVPYAALILTAAGAGGVFLLLLPVYLLSSAYGWALSGTTLLVVTMTVAGCASALATIAAIACRTIIADLGHRLDMAEARALAQIRTFLDGESGGGGGEPVRVNGEEVLGEMAGELVAMPNSKAFQLGREIERRRWERGGR
jgi:hypothetical protein